METNNNVAAAAQKERERVVKMLDDNIRGIARKTAKAFYEIGISSFTDLHEYLVEHTDHEVFEALRAQGVKPVTNWIERYDLRGQARQKARQANAVHKPSKEKAAVAKKPEDMLNHAASCEKADAAFTLLFNYVTDERGKKVLQTVVYDEKVDGKEEIFTGTDTAPWVNRILERARLPLPQVPESAPAKVAPPSSAKAEALPLPTPSCARIEVLDTGIKRSPDIQEKILTAAVRFGITGSGIEALLDQETPFEVIIYLAHLPSGPVRLIASERSQLEKRQVEYTSQFTFPIPDLGRYELQCIVLLLPPGELFAFHRGQIINVVP
jgi:hypothetical protein